MRGGASSAFFGISKKGGDAYGYNKRFNADDFIRHVNPSLSCPIKIKSNPSCALICSLYSRQRNNKNLYYYKGSLYYV